MILKSPSSLAALSCLFLISSVARPSSTAAAALDQADPVSMAGDGERANSFDDTLMNNGRKLKFRRKSGSEQLADDADDAGEKKGRKKMHKKKNNKKIKKKKNHNSSKSLAGEEGEEGSPPSSKASKSKSPKTGKSMETKSRKSSKDSTMEPTMAPTGDALSPTGSPTSCQHSDVTYHFDLDLEEPPTNFDQWSFSGEGIWAMSSDESFSGQFSLKSPNVTMPAFNTTSFATLHVCEDFLGGKFTFQVYASVQPPHDIFHLYIDGSRVVNMVNTNGWVEIVNGLPPGNHTIDFRYEYNIFSLDEQDLPPRAEGLKGAVWIDNVQIETLV